MYQCKTQEWKQNEGTSGWQKQKAFQGSSQGFYSVKGRTWAKKQETPRIRDQAIQSSEVLRWKYTTDRKSDCSNRIRKRFTYMNETKFQKQAIITSRKPQLYDNILST